MIVFLDESGDLGFDFEAKQPSRFFTITLLVCDDRRALDGFRKAVRRTLKNKLNRKKSRRRVQELHGSDTALAIKRYFARQMPDRGWQLYSVTLNKQRVQPHLTTRSGKKKLYNFLARFLLEQLPLEQATENVSLVVDKSKNTEEIPEAKKRRSLLRRIPRAISQPMEGNTRGAQQDLPVESDSRREQPQSQPGRTKSQATPTSHAKENAEQLLRRPA